MYNSGFTLLYRDEWQDWLLNDPKKFVWWLRLRSMATHEECVRRLIIGKSTVKVSISFGEIATTWASLSSTFRADERSIKEFVGDMEDEGRLVSRRENGVLIIKINNYEKFSPTGGTSRTGEMSNGRHGQKIVNAVANPQTVTMADTDIHAIADTSFNPRAETQPQMQTLEINIDKEKNIENLKNKNRERIEEFFKKLKASSNEEKHWLSQAIGCEEADLPNLIAQFEGYALLNPEDYANYGAFQKHFINRVSKIHRDKSQTKKNSYGKTTRETGGGVESSASRRRGADGTPRADSEYRKPFPTRPTE